MMPPFLYLFCLVLKSSFLSLWILCTAVERSKRREHIMRHLFLFLAGAVKEKCVGSESCLIEFH
jgi:hypothetical protein